MRTSSSSRRDSILERLLARYPLSLTSDVVAALDAREPDDTDCAAEEIAFAAVPRLRRRIGGWTEDRQRAFIAALQRCGSVASAARSVGLTARSAYRLVAAEGAREFAAAWDQAFREGLERLRIDALDRALHGALVPVYRRGRLVRVEHRRSDRLAIALLSGREKDVAFYRRNAVVSHDWADRDRKRAVEQAKHDSIWAEHQAVLEAIEAEQAKPTPRIPRIIQL